ncbi:ABC transporter ATP-binding protein [Demequina lutea]|uniref:ABC-2 type transport system ATP-binding protein n=1 Tax=Demequina lutea TaxID=431489 RepID=A0A7Y9ZB54_9MICO|nr:ABC transporter ATP-binding protein [Demequina lutea]NYI42124.1 ABC-2 type transport system ATP-binding protein [Demequina lutea]
MIRTHGLVKRYGTHAALDGVDLEVPAGSVYGLAGPNGAGKTTLLGILAGLRKATEGEVTVAAETGEVAVLPDTPRFDPWLTGREVVALALTLGSGTHSVTTREDAERVDEVLEQSGLTDAARRRCGGYSRGMLQRLGIASTLVARPSLILLDEPASALDPQGRREVLDLINTLRGHATVLFSSHILGDVQEVCDTVGILHHGRLLFQGPLSDLLVGRAVPRYELRVRDGADAVAGALSREAWVSSATAAEGGIVHVEVRSLADAERHLMGALAATGASVVSMRPEEVSLERAFLELTS